MAAGVRIAPPQRESSPPTGKEAQIGRLYRELGATARRNGTHTRSSSWGSSARTVPGTECELKITAKDAREQVAYGPTSPISCARSSSPCPTLLQVTPGLLLPPLDHDRIDGIRTRFARKNHCPALITSPTSGHCSLSAASWPASLCQLIAVSRVVQFHYLANHGAPTPTPKLRCPNETDQRYSELCLPPNHPPLITICDSDSPVSPSGFTPCSG
jgi:hypothetical protein